ncbi:MAG: sel1 repeat family protein, partial [Deferribacteraceae bacterium]|nr:sel1 repeat family protein [Deferribacteraceae bacterium]
MHITWAKAWQDYAEAVKWYLLAAEQGDMFAQCELGYAYKKGMGVEPNIAEAKKWWRKAAEQGEENAARELNYKYKPIDTSAYASDEKMIGTVPAPKIFLMSISGRYGRLNAINASIIVGLIACSVKFLL